MQYACSYERDNEQPEALVLVESDINELIDLVVALPPFVVEAAAQV
jgi:hypothetical protein